MRLEKIAPGRYSYATQRFPFDGELEGLHTGIDDVAAAVGGAGQRIFTGPQPDGCTAEDDVRNRAAGPPGRASWANGP